jgi:hypothetical protein
MKQNEEVILEEQPIRNIQMEDVLQKSLDFNKQYIQYLKTRLEEAKKIREEILNG